MTRTWRDASFCESLVFGEMPGTMGQTSAIGRGLRDPLQTVDPVEKSEHPIRYSSPLRCSLE